MSEFTSCDDCTDNMKQSNCSICIHNNMGDFFEPKPKQKIVKLEEMVGSDIDMEFSNMAIPFIHTHDIYIGKLTGFDESIPDKKFYIKDKVGKHYKCRIRQDHWHHWNGDECPLPEGFEIEIEYYDRDDGELIREGLNNYRNMGWSNITGFKVLGTADNTIYEWQKEKKE